MIQDNFPGVNAVYHGIAFMPEQVHRGMNAADHAREFERVERMGLNITRTWYRPDWACGNDLMHPFDWNSTKWKARLSQPAKRFGWMSEADKMKPTGIPPTMAGI